MNANGPPYNLFPQGVSPRSSEHCFSIFFFIIGKKVGREIYIEAHNDFDMSKLNSVLKGN